MKKSLIWAIAIAIAMGLVISSASSMPTEKKTTENEEIIAHFLPVQCVSLNSKAFESSEKPMTLASIQVTMGENDEYHPSIAGSPEEGYYALAEYTEDGIIWHPMLYGSGDGVIWDPLVEFLYDNAEYTDMDQNAHGTYGTFGAAPDSSGQMIVVQGEILDGWVWDFGPNNLNEFTGNRIDCYTYEGPDGDPGDWNWGGLSLVGYNGFGSNDISGCPFIFYQYSAAGGGIIGWLTGAVDGCEHVGSAMDLATNIHYAVYDRDNAGTYELLIRKDDFGAWIYNSAGDYWTHQYQTSYHVTDTSNLMYPSAAAYDDNVVVACQKDNDVVVFYSTNGFSSHTEVLVQTEASYPEVVMAAGGIVVITYIKDDVLYMRTSDTGGASWSDPHVVVSDNQVNLNDRAANLDEFLGDVYCVWEDVRGTSIDCYYDIIWANPNHPPEAPTINGPNGGKPGKPLNFQFSAIDPDGDQVRFFIQWGDTTSEWTDYVDSGTSVSVSHTWEEEGAYTITALAEDTNSLQGPETTKPINIPRGKTVVKSLFLQFLQQYPNTFPILRQLLGL